MLRSRLDRLTGHRDGIKAVLLKGEQDLVRLQTEEEEADLAASILRTLIDNEVSVGVKAVEELLTEGLRVVFDDQELSVRAEVDVQRGKVGVEFITVQKHPDGTLTEGISREAYGGAVTTVQSVLLRVIVMMRRGLRMVSFMDETLPAFDSNYVHNMGTFLRTLCERLGVDLLLVSHNPAMVEAADHAYKISKTNGSATFKQIR